MARILHIIKTSPIYLFIYLFICFGTIEKVESPITEVQYNELQYNNRGCCSSVVKTAN
jgi:hypothetical protein